MDQDAAIIVTGYVGEVVARLHIDQSLTMEQDVGISFSIDGDGHFSIDIDQDMHILQSVEIDLDIRDMDGVLYVDLFLRDVIVVEQDTFVDIAIGDGVTGGSVAIDQDLVLDQDLDVDIDIEDDIEERYTVTVTLDVRQNADVDQSAAVDAVCDNGQLDLDVSAIQTALVEQETVVHADFALV